MSARGQVSENMDAGNMLRPVAVSVVLGAVVSVLFLVLLSLVVSAGSVPQSMIDPMAIFAMSMGAFASGLCCARVIRKNGLVCGLLCGIIFSAVILMCGFAVKDNGLGLAVLIKIMFMLISSMLGGVLGVNSKKRKK